MERLKSRPGRPSPPFLGFIMAANGYSLDKQSIERILREIEEQVSVLIIIIEYILKIAIKESLVTNSII
jgi:hypothetical protein